MEALFKAFFLLNFLFKQISSTKRVSGRSRAFLKLFYKFLFEFLSSQRSVTAACVELGL